MAFDSPCALARSVTTFHSRTQTAISIQYDAKDVITHYLGTPVTVRVYTVGSGVVVSLHNRHVHRSSAQYKFQMLAPLFPYSGAHNGTLGSSIINYFYQQF